MLFLLDNENEDEKTDYDTFGRVYGVDGKCADRERGDYPLRP